MTPDIARPAPEILSMLRQGESAVVQTVLRIYGVVLRMAQLYSSPRYEYNII